MSRGTDLNALIPSDVKNLDDCDDIHRYRQAKPDRVERFTTQIMTSAEVVYDNDRYKLLDILQDEVLYRMRRGQEPIDLVEGNYDRDNFIGKQLCHKRYKTYAKFCCQNSQCGNKWTSDSTTIEMILQDVSSHRQAVTKLISKHGSPHDHSRNQVKTCNVIIRSYLQLCKSCQTIGSIKLKANSVEQLVSKQVVDIFKFYNVGWQRATIQPYRRRQNVKQAPHEQDLCLACLQGSCAWKWPKLDDEVQKLHNIYFDQVAQNDIPLKVMYQVVALYKQYGNGPNNEDQPIGDSIDHLAALRIWQAHSDLGDMDRVQAAEELLPLMRRHIDWSKIYIKDTSQM